MACHTCIGGWLPEPGSCEVSGGVVELESGGMGSDGGMAPREMAPRRKGGVPMAAIGGAGRLGGDPHQSQPASDSNSERRDHDCSTLVALGRHVVLRMRWRCVMRLNARV